MFSRHVFVVVKLADGKVRLLYFLPFKVRLLYFLPFTVRGREEEITVDRFLTVTLCIIMNSV